MSARKILFASFIGLFCAGPLAAQFQTGTISGRVVDGTTSEIIADAVVTLEGTRRGTTTGPDGRFTLTDVPAGMHFVTARLIGYGPQTQEVTVTAGLASTVEFTLPRQAIVMDELVVTGYGSQRRAAITGAVATVNADEANVGLTTNADDLIKGRVAGVSITSNGGEPGAGVQIRVRGGTSISAGDEPLYVVDGVAIQPGAREPGGEGIGGEASLARNPLNLINPNDIESITVLKDAAAAAIYGVQGANGVILIETKQGQRDRTSFEYDGYVSVATPARSLDVLNGAEYRQFIQDQVAAGNLPASRLDDLGSANTDWEKAVTRSAVTHNHNLAFSGGTGSTLYRASLNYMNQEGVALSSGLERMQARLNATHYAWDDRLQVRLNLTSSHIRNDYVPFQDGGGFEGAVLQNMVQFNPTQPVTLTDPETGQEVFYEIGTGRLSTRNPVAMAEQLRDFANTTRTLGNIRAQLDIVPDAVSGQLIVGVDRSESTRRIYYPGATPVGAEWNGRAFQKSLENTTANLQGLLTLTPRLGDASELEFVGGYEYVFAEFDQFSAEARDFLTDAFGFDNLEAGGELLPQRSYREEARLASFFSRTTFGYKDRYFLTGVLRFDGASQFGSGNKWGTFPAASGSWRIGQEDFMLDGPFSELRLRAGYGIQGNPAVTPYSSLITLQPGDRYVFGEQAIVGVAPTRNPNPDLKWEKTSQFNIGVDFGLLDNRLSGSIEYYVKNTSDLLLEVTVPQPAVQERRLENVGKVSNKGLEATLDALLMNRSNMTWQIGLVFAAERNKVVDLGGQSFITTGFVSGPGQTGQVSQRLLPGEPLGTFYGPEFAGVDDQGRQLFNDYEDDVLVGETTDPDADDFRVLGDANPDFELGLRSQLTWGGLDASILVRAKQGLEVFNNTALVYATKSFALTDKNFLASAVDDGVDITQPAIYSSRWIEDGSYIRLENITVGYSLDLPGFLGAGGRPARVYISGDNLLLLTGYDGYDPEAHTSRGNIAVRGIDYLSYPRARTFSAGLQVSF